MIVGNIQPAQFQPQRHHHDGIPGGDGAAAVRDERRAALADHAAADQGVGRADSLSCEQPCQKVCCVWNTSGD